MTNWVPADAAEVARGAVALDERSIERIRDDQSLTALAVVVLAVASFLSGLGSYFWFGVEIEWSGEVFWKAAIVGSILMAAAWILLAAIAWVVLRASQPELTFTAVLRVAGVSAAPLALGLLVFIPRLGFGIGVLAPVLAAAVLAIALQSAFRVTPGRALMATAAGIAPWCLLLSLFVSSDDPFGAGIFGLEWGSLAMAELAEGMRALEAIFG